MPVDIYIPMPGNSDEDDAKEDYMIDWLNENVGDHWDWVKDGTVPTGLYARFTNPEDAIMFRLKFGL